MKFSDILVKEMFISTLIFLALNSGIQSQVLDWGLNIGGSASDFSKSLSVDGSGNIYLMGEVGSNNVDFDPGTSSTSLSCDAYIVKYSDTGSFEWIIPFGDCYSGSNFVDPYSLDVDGNGDVYVTGSFEGTVDFDPDSGTTNLSAGINQNVFIAKYSSNGSLLWCFDLGSSSDDWGSKIKYDGSTNIYVYGSFKGTVDFDPSASTQNLSADLYGDAFLAKYDTAGNYVWAFSIANGRSSTYSCMEISNSGEILIGGWFYDTTDFDPGVNVAQFLPVQTGGYQNMFFASYNANMTYNWGNHLKGSSSSDFNALEIDASGNILVTGRLNGSVDFDPGSGTYSVSGGSAGSIFLGKYNSSGDFLWAFKIGSNINPSYSVDVGVDVFGNAYITGQFPGTLDFDPGTGVANISTTSGGYIAKYSGSGNYLWAHAIPTAFGYGYGIEPLDSARVAFTGYFTGSGDFDPSIDTATFTSNGNQDIYLMVYEQCLPSFTKDTIGSCYSFVSPSGKYTWTVSGNYTDSLISAEGCDSIVDISLSIYDTLIIDSVNTSDFACDSGTVNLYAYPSKGYIKWFDVPSGGSALDTGVLFTTPVIDTITTYYLEVSNDTCTSSRIPIVASVKHSPQITSTTENTVCDSGTTILSATPGASASIRWFSASTGGSSLDTGNNFTTPFLNTPSTFYAEVYNSSCINTNRVPVFADVVPSPIITSVTDGSNCGPGNITLYATADTGKIYWYGSTTSLTPYDSGNAFTRYHSFVYTPYYVSASLKGCSSSPRDTVGATVISPPTFTVHSGIISLCGPGVANFQATPSAGFVFLSDSSSGGTILDTSLSGTLTTPAISSSTLFYIGANDRGCLSTTRNGVNVIVNQIPSVDSTIDGSTCDSGSVQLQIVAIGAKKWFASLTDTIVLQTGSTYNTPTINSRTTYYVSTTSTAGCTSPRDSVVAHVYESFLTSVSDSACLEYLSPSGKYIYKISGKYKDTLYASSGCDSVIELNLVIDTVNTQISQNANTLTSKAQFGSYQWIDCENDNALIPNETGQIFVASKNGSYAVVITQGNCTDTSKCFSVLNIGFEDLGKESALIYPNPFSDFLIISLKKVYGQIEITIVNELGQFVLDEERTNTDEVQLDLSTLNSGTYAISIESNEGKLNYLIIKQ